MIDEQFVKFLSLYKFSVRYNFDDVIVTNVVFDICIVLMSIMPETF